MRTGRWWWSAAAIVLLAVAGAALLAGEAGAQKGALPKPRERAGVDLFAALKGRHSNRRFDAKKAIPDDVLASVLWAADGVNRGNGKHTSPSALGLRYMRIYVCRADGAWRYDQDAHRLLPVAKEDLRGKVGRQGFMADAPVVLVLTSDLSAFERGGRSPSDAARRQYSHATAGCIAQNVYLAAEAFGLGTVMAGMIRRDEIRKGLSLAEKEEPLYIMPLGYPPAE